MDPHNDNYDNLMFKLNQYKNVNIVNFVHNVKTLISLVVTSTWLNEARLPSTAKLGYDGVFPK